MKYLLFAIVPSIFTIFFLSERAEADDKKACLGLFKKNEPASILYLSSDDYQKACRSYIKSLDKESASNSALLEAYFGYIKRLEEGYSEDRILIRRTYNKILEISPNNVDALAGLAENYFEQGKLDKAIEALENAENHSVKKDRLHLLRAKIFVKQKKYSDARIYIDKYIDKNPKSTIGYKVRENIYYEIGNYEGRLKDLYALKSIDNRLKLESDIVLTLCYLRNYEIALKHIEDFLEVENDNDFFLFLGGKLYERKGDWESALENYQRAISASRRTIRNYLAAGVASLKLQDKKSANRYFGNAVELSLIGIKKDIEASGNREIGINHGSRYWTYLAIGMALQGDEKLSIKFLTNLIEQYDDAVVYLGFSKSKLFFERGLIYRRFGSYENATADFMAGYELLNENAKRDLQVSLLEGGYTLPQLNDDDISGVLSVVVTSDIGNYELFRDYFSRMLPYR